MSKKNSDIMEKIPSGCPSPMKIEKTESSSSQQSEFPLRCSIESCIISDHINQEERIRPSSWDDSEDDLSSDSEANTQSSQFYSSDSEQNIGSVVAGINEIKKQFFEMLEKVKQENDDRDLESLKKKIEMKLNSDRRQSPARMRRRTKSSNSTSPVLESKNHNSPEKSEKSIRSAAVLDEISLKILDFDPKFYLNSFFTELRSRSISLTDSAPVIAEVAESADCHEEYFPIFNEVTSSITDENDVHFCMTSRKLSQILEVEENKTDLEISSEEKLKNPKWIFKTSKNTEESSYSPLQTARSKKSEKIQENMEETKKEQGKFKLLSNEDFENFQIISKPFQGSLSERSVTTIEHKIKDSFISPPAKNRKTQFNLDLWQDGKNASKQFQSVSPTSPAESNKDLPIESSPKETEKSFDSPDCLKIDLMKIFASENSTPKTTPKKSTERSERSHINKTLSAKSSQSWNLESPKFTINVGKDSTRSLMIEDVNTPDSLRKHSETRTPTKLKTPSFDYCSPKENNKITGPSEYSLELVTDRNLLISPGSLGQESVKSTLQNSKESEEIYLKSPRSSHKSYRKIKSQRKNHQITESKSVETNLTLMVENTSEENSGSYKNSCRQISNRSESSGKFLNAKISNTDELKSQKSAKTPDTKSSRSLKSDKSGTSKRREDRLNDQTRLSDRGMANKNKISELSRLRIEILEEPKSQNRSYRSTETESDDFTKARDESETNSQKISSHRASERDSYSRNKNSGSKRSTPRSLRAISKTNSSTSSLSKDGLENHDESENAKSLRIAAWKELEKVCDIMSNRTSASSASRRKSWRESDVSSQQHFDRTELSDFTTTPKNNSSEETLPKSRKSSRGSADALGLDVIDNHSPSRSIKKKSRPSSCTSNEHKTADINSDTEKLHQNSENEKTTNEIFFFEEDDESEKRYLTQKSETEAESEIHSNKRLSIINEASLEDLEVSTENEEKRVSDQPRPNSRKDSRQSSPKSVRETLKGTTKISSTSLKENISDELVSQLNNTDDGRWNELLQKFYENSNASFIFKDTFTYFPHKKENLCNWDGNSNTEENKIDNENHENQETFNNLSQRYEENELPMRTLSSKKTLREKDEDLKSPYLAYEDPFLETVLKEKTIRPQQKSQNQYYFNIDKVGPFEIGEFGDITCWNACQSDQSDWEKPKDHGDGIQTQKTSEILVRSEKREKEIKTHRHLWTELKEDIRDSKPFLSNLFLEIENNINLEHLIPIGVKTSKSENCIKKKTSEISNVENPVVYEFLSEYNRTPKNMGNKFMDFEIYAKGKSDSTSSSKSTIEQHSSLESLVHEKYSEHEIEYEITPRLSRSLTNIVTQLEKENLTSRSEKNLKTSRMHGFEKSTNSISEEKEFTDLNIFLAQNGKEKMAVRSNNWLHFTNSKGKKFYKRNQKIKKKRKNSISSKDSIHEYLPSTKIGLNVPHLKLKNPNCFQNFYKRFISVFCLTSTSSAATSK